MIYSLLRALLLVMCASGAVYAQVSARPWLDVPFVKQEKNGCGAASIAMVMQYWQKQQGLPSNGAAEEAHIYRALYVPGADGIYASAMEGYFKKHQFRTFSVNGDWDLLRQHLQKGRPLIAALKPLGASSGLHYVVVVGLDPKQDILFLNDPAQRKLLKLDRSDFEKEWSVTGNWTLLAVPQPEGSR